MKHQILNTLIDADPFERVKVELIPTEDHEKEEIVKLSKEVESYLTLKLGAVKILEASAPVFLIRRVKG